MWISVSERLPEMENSEHTKTVLMYFGTHAETGVFYFDDEYGKPYHVFFDGDTLCSEPTHWCEYIPPTN